MTNKEIEEFCNKYAGQEVEGEGYASNQIRKGRLIGYRVTSSDNLLILIEGSSQDPVFLSDKKIVLVVNDPKPKGWFCIPNSVKPVERIVHAAASEEDVWCGANLDPIEIPTLSWQNTTCLPCLEAGLRFCPNSKYIQERLDFLLSNKKEENRYPHKCPRCNGDAYIGLYIVDCKAKCGG